MEGGAYYVVAAADEDKVVGRGEASAKAAARAAEIVGKERLDEG